MASDKIWYGYQNHKSTCTQCSTEQDCPRGKELSIRFHRKGEAISRAAQDYAHRKVIGYVDWWQNK